MAEDLVMPNEAYNKPVSTTSPEIPPSTAGQSQSIDLGLAAKPILGEDLSKGEPQFNVVKDTYDDSFLHQSDASKMINGLAKGGGKAVSSFARTFTDIIAGYPYGIGKSMEEGRFDASHALGSLANMASDINPLSYIQSDYNPFYSKQVPDLGITYYARSNPASEVLRQFDIDAEKKFPNYYSNKENNNNVLQNMFSGEGWANFWGDKVLNNFGFTVGSMGAMMLTSYLGAGALGLSGEAAGTRNAAGLMAEQMTNAESSIRKGSTALNKLATGLRNKGLINTVTSSGIAANQESNMEAVSAGLEFEKSEYAKIKVSGREPDEYDKKRIEEAKEAVSNSVYAMNMPLLMVDNIVQFGNSLKHIALQEPLKLSKFIVPSGESLADVTGVRTFGELTTKTSTTKNLLDYARRILTPAISEGNEEMGQQAISTAAKEYYSQYGKNDGKSNIKDLITAIGKGLEDGYGSKNGLEQGLIGGLTGLLGIPFAGHSKVGKFNIPIAGGLFEQIADKQMEDSRYASAAEYFKNNPKLIEKILDNYNTAVATHNNDDQFTSALKDKSIFGTGNAQSNNIINMVRDAVDNGGYEILQHRLNSLKELKADDVKQDLGIDVSQFDDANKNKYIADISNKAREIKDLTDAVRGGMPQLDKHTQDILIFSAATIKDAVKRREDIGNELSEITEGIFNPVVTSTANLSTKEGSEQYNQMIDRLEDYLHTGNNSINKAPIVHYVDEYTKLQSRINEYTSLYNFVLNKSKSEKGIMSYLKFADEIQSDIEKQEVKTKNEQLKNDYIKEGVNKATEAVNTNATNETLEDIRNKYKHPEVENVIQKEIKHRKDVEFANTLENEEVVAEQNPVKDKVEEVVPTDTSSLSSIPSGKNPATIADVAEPSPLTQFQGMIKGLEDARTNLRNLNNIDDVTKAIENVRNTIDTSIAPFLQTIAENHPEAEAIRNLLPRVGEIENDIVKDAVDISNGTSLRDIAVAKNDVISSETNTVAPKAVDVNADIVSTELPRTNLVDVGISKEDVIKVTPSSAKMWVQNLDNIVQNSKGYVRDDGTLVITDDDSIKLAQGVFNKDGIKVGDKMEVKVSFNEYAQKFHEQFNNAKEDKTKRDTLIRESLPIGIVYNGDINLWYNDGMYLNSEKQLINKLVDAISTRGSDAISEILMTAQDLKQLEKTDTADVVKLSDVLGKVKSVVNKYISDESIGNRIHKDLLEHMANLLNYTRIEDIGGVIESLNKWKTRIEEDSLATGKIHDEVIKQLDGEATNDLSKVKIDVGIVDKTVGSFNNGGDLQPIRDVFSGKDFAITKVSDFENQLVSLKDGSSYFNTNDSAYSKRNIYLLVTNTPNGKPVPTPVFGMQLKTEDVGKITDLVNKYINVDVNSVAELNQVLKSNVRNVVSEISKIVHLNDAGDKGKLHFKVKTKGFEDRENPNNFIYSLVEFSVSDTEAISIVRNQNKNGNYSIEVLSHPLKKNGQIDYNNITVKANGFNYDMIKDAISKKRYNINYMKFDTNTGKWGNKTNEELYSEIKQMMVDSKLGTTVRKVVSIDDNGNDKFLSYFQLNGDRPLTIASKIIDSSETKVEQISKDPETNIVNSTDMSVTTNKNAAITEVENTLANEMVADNPFTEIMNQYGKYEAELLAKGIDVQQLADEVMATGTDITENNVLNVIKKLIC